MSLDTIFAKAIEKIATDQGKDLKEMVHAVLKLSSPDISIREFRRITRPDKKGRLRSITLKEAFEFGRLLGKGVDDIIAYGLLME